MSKRLVAATDNRLLCLCGWLRHRPKRLPYRSPRLKLNKMYRCSIPPPPPKRGWPQCRENEREKSDAYFEGGYWLILWNFLLAAAISIFSAGFPNLGAAARFFTTNNQVQEVASSLLRDAVFGDCLRIKFSSESV